MAEKSLREKIAKVFYDCGKAVSCYEYADQILSLFRAEIDKAELTDEKFLEWCGSHHVKGCGQNRKWKVVDKPDRDIIKCEDCRAYAQLDAIKELLEG